MADEQQYIINSINGREINDIIFPTYYIDLSNQESIINYIYNINGRKLWHILIVEGVNLKRLVYTDYTDTHYSYTISIDMYGTVISIGEITKQCCYSNPPTEYECSLTDLNLGTATTSCITTKRKDNELNTTDTNVPYYIIDESISLLFNPPNPTTNPSLMIVGIIGIGIFLYSSLKNK